jgi:HKD family nuclease
MRESKCTEVALASGYLTLTGVKHLQPALKQALGRGGVSVKVLTGIKDNFTEGEALAYLLRLRSQYPDRLSIRLSRNTRFHAKCYLFGIGDVSKVVIGSANLTSAGMSTDGELSVQLEGKWQNPSLLRFWGWFQRQFRSATELDERLLEAYRNSWVDTRPNRPPNNDARKRLLHLLRPVRPQSGPGKQRQWWLTDISGTLSDPSMKVLLATPWYRKKEPELICFPEQPSAFDRVDKGDCLVVLDYTRGKRRGWMRLATVTEVHDSPQTEDGRYFLVLKYPRHRKKRLSRAYTDSWIARDLFKRKRFLHNLQLKELKEKQIAILAKDLDVRP